FLPVAYVAPRELRDLRDLLRHRATLTRMRSAVKNRVHAILAKHGITNEHSDLFGKGGREFLATLELREAPPKIGQPDRAGLRRRPRDRANHARDRAAPPTPMTASRCFARSAAWGATPRC